MALQLPGVNNLWVELPAIYTVNKAHCADVKCTHLPSTASAYNLEAAHTYVVLHLQVHLSQTFYCQSWRSTHTSPHYHVCYTKIAYLKRVTLHHMKLKGRCVQKLTGIKFFCLLYHMKKLQSNWTDWQHNMSNSLPHPGVLLLGRINAAYHRTCIKLTPEEVHHNKYTAWLTISQHGHRAADMESTKRPSFCRLEPLSFNGSAYPQWCIANGLSAMLCRRFILLVKKFSFQHFKFKIRDPHHAQVKEFCFTCHR